MNEKKTPRQHRLLFICLGNICRSPAAEGVMKALASAAGRSADFHIDSAGIGDWHAGQLPDSRMRRRGALRGYNFDSRARQIRRSDFTDFNLLLVMDSSNFTAVSGMAASSQERGKVVMLTDFLTRHNNVKAVPDPYYGDETDFDYALDLIEDACSGLLEKLA